MKNLYLFLAVLGTIVPYFFFVDFINAEGVNLTQFIALLFANAPASGFTSDLLITSVAFWIWMIHESKQLRMKYSWMLVVLNLTVGLSCAFPLFMYFRQAKLERIQGADSQHQSTYANAF